MNISRLSTLLLSLVIAVVMLGYANSSSAAKKGIDCTDPTSHPSCKDKGDGDDSGRDETFYDVVISPNTFDKIVGESDDDHPWLTFGNGTSIGLGDASLSPPGERPGIGEFTDLSFFTSSGGPFNTKVEGDDDDRNQGQIYFPVDGDEDDEGRDGGTFSIHQGRVQEGRGGRAQATFWFHGFTHTDVDGAPVKVLYALLLTGIFSVGSLPPTGGNFVLLSMTAWQLTATNEGQAVKSASCIGDGAEEFDVTVMVIEHE